MARLTSLLTAVAAAVVGTAQAILPTDWTPICKEIESKISNTSDVIYPLQAVSFTLAIAHWFWSSDEQPSCVFAPGSAEDVSVALQIIGATKTPFAVQSGGHSSNPGFSSTKGVHISLKRLNQVKLSADKSVAEIGFGNIWTDVYKVLDGTGRNVVGGRVPGPGVGGLTLGGGYSWKTNQYGMTCDTVKSYELVLPNGTITRVSKTENPDLYFALKGGLNRFGIVTSAEFYTHEQPEKVYGGLGIYPTTAVDQILNATSQFSYLNKDPRTQIITTLDGGPLGTTAEVLFFHDGPDKPASFELFDNITPLVKTVQSQSFVSFVQSIPAQVPELTNIRGAFITVATSELSQTFLEAVRQETDDMGKIMSLHGGITVSYDLEPFTKYGEHATESAFPHTESPLPLFIYFAWSLPENDDFWYARMKQTVEALKKVAIDDGIYSDAFTYYPNYSLFDATAEQLYGNENAARLARIRDQVDPDRIMELAGGFTI
ncbi:hypothetical protein NEUTE1DRAFT_109527 [Neurospora tetrasperma FGSC 2508]|uniref:FAD-binding PCMH-type domain-containing protein n=1 Tax=Neurospora tetrasperma (strain FGSC 2508 / ATCC MYA-4615 / P0657) TaxID=510951 RepID=F8MN75_NEUT8|nr:uncharacterized protein NEUTE1DRAFT_109527 [Neurospora tetrasperma FGSC 2508]EGO57248.1 hypothetical protein NEUTE1DRAFT_109527 [Neurospora tetrasperma FGSC 2508]EGZ72506.1 FAD-binding domain-containing protein [Neurospora tetrasperma FGSC 2509]